MKILFFVILFLTSSWAYAGDADTEADDGIPLNVNLAQPAGTLPDAVNSFSENMGHPCPSAVLAPGRPWDEHSQDQAADSAEKSGSHP